MSARRFGKTWFVWTRTTSTARRASKDCDRIVGINGRGAVRAQAVKSTNNMPTFMCADVAQRQEHAVHGTTGNASVRSSSTRTKPGSPPFLEHCGLPSASTVREEHLAALDENACVFVDRRVDEEMTMRWRCGGCQNSAAVAAARPGACRHARAPRMDAAGCTSTVTESCRVAGEVKASRDFNRSGQSGKLRALLINNLGLLTCKDRNIRKLSKAIDAPVLDN